MSADLTTLAGDLTALSEDMTSVSEDLTTMSEDLTTMSEGLTTMSEGLTKVSEGLIETTDYTFTTPVGKLSRYDLKAPVLHQVMASLILVTCAFGLVGNTICAVVLTKMEKSLGGMKLLKYLSYLDILLLILGYIDFAMGKIDPTFNMDDRIRNAMLPIAHPLALTVYTTEIYLTLLIALQRCVAITRPLHYSRMMNDAFLFKILILIVILAAGFNIPHWIAYPPELYWEPDMNTTWFKNDVSEFGKSYGFREVYSGYVTLVVRTVIPMLLLSVANVVIVVSVRRNIGIRKEMTNSQDNKNGRTTAVILAITTMSIFTHFTSASVRILMIFWESDITIAKEAFINFSTLLIVINSSCNFIFYCMFGKEFRKALQTLCHR